MCSAPPGGSHPGMAGPPTAAPGGGVVNKDYLKKKKKKQRQSSIRKNTRKAAMRGTQTKQYTISQATNTTTDGIQFNQDLATSNQACAKAI